LCVRGLVIGEFLGSFDHQDATLDAEELLTKKFPDYLKPIYRSIRVWTTTEIAQSSHPTSISQTTGYSPPDDREVWTTVLYDGPLINLAVLANGVLSCSNDEGVNFDIAWKTLETLLKLHGPAQVRMSDQARTRFTQVVNKAHARVKSYERGRAPISPLLDILDIIVSGLRLTEVLACAPKLPPRQIRAVFGREQLRNSELLEAFATCLPQHVTRNDPEISKNFMERLILEDKLWENLHGSLSDCLHPQVQFQDKLRTTTAVFDILDVTFMTLKDSSAIDWQSPGLDLLFRSLTEFVRTMVIDPDLHVKKIASSHVAFASIQFCHAVLAQFSMQCGPGEPFIVRSLNALSIVAWVLGLGSQEDWEYLTAKNTEATPGLIHRFNAILNAVRHDGPLSNFCGLARLTLDLKLTKASDSTFENIKKSLTMLTRMLDNPHLPFDNASGEMWARFDDLRDEVRSRAGVVVPESRAQNAGTPKSLEEMIEEVEQVRPPIAMCVEGPERDDIQICPPASGVVDLDTQQPTPISSSSMQPAGASPTGTGNITDSGPDIFLLTPGPITTPGNISRSLPGALAPHSDLDANSGAHQRPTISILTTQPGRNGGNSYLYPPYWHDPGVHHPVIFSPSYGHGMRNGMRAFRRASTLDSRRLLAYAPMQSMLGIPHDMYQQSPVAPRAPSLCSSPDSDYGDCMYIFLCLDSYR